MRPEMLRERQRRGRVFYEMFPGAKVSDDWMTPEGIRNRLELKE